MLLAQSLSMGSTIFLVLAVGMALAFEFVNGFHDTANAVATVIYTHTLRPWVAVIWSGCWNLIGVLTSSGAIAFTILALLPVELVLNVGSGSGFAMVFALLLAAILWNLGTWYLGLPASSSHTLIGSIMGVGLANSMMSKGHVFGDGVNWGKVMEVFKGLLVSPLVGFVFAGLLLLVAKAFLKRPELFKAPPKDAPPPPWIRALLIFTCTAVSFGHGSNDGQKGMGLMLLILIGILPGLYALNPDTKAETFQQLTTTALLAEKPLAAHAGSASIKPEEADDELSGYLKVQGVATDRTFAALGVVDHRIVQTLTGRTNFDGFTDIQRKAVRSDIYLVGASLDKLIKDKKITDKAELSLLAGEKDSKQNPGFVKQLTNVTQFIPYWVKVAVAIALGLGTMIGWKRIVVTVGEKIGKDHLTYAQGASAEIVAAVTIQLADMYHLPVSTTHVLSSGVAGTMAANKSGLQMDTLRNLLLAWVLTLPVCVILGAGTFAAGLFIVINNFVTHAVIVVGVLLLVVGVLLFRRIAASKISKEAGMMMEAPRGNKLLHLWLR